MGSSEDRARAARAKERGRGEREEAEREASERAEAVRFRAKQKEDRMAASCSGFSFFLTDGFVATAFTLPVLAIATFGWMFTEPRDRDVATIGISIAVPVAILLLCLVLFARARVRAAWQAEKQWMAGLPFAIDTLGEGVGSTSSNHRLVVRVTFRDEFHKLPFDDARGLLTHVDPGGEVGSRDKMLELRARVAGDPEGDIARVKARRLLFHDLVDGVLLPLSERHPIARIALDD